MTKAMSTFSGVIVIDQLPYDARANLPLEGEHQSELRQALVCLASEYPLDSLEFEEEPVRLPETPRYPALSGAQIRRRSTVCVAARIERLLSELDSETTALLTKIDTAKSA